MKEARQAKEVPDCTMDRWMEAYASQETSSRQQLGVSKLGLYCASGNGREGCGQQWRPSVISERALVEVHLEWWRRYTWLHLLSLFRSFFLSLLHPCRQHLRRTLVIPFQ